jgi:hypothetical protein
MESTDQNSTDDIQNNLPEPGISSEPKTNIAEQENHPETGSETETEAATDYTDPDNKPADLSKLDDVRDEARGDDDGSLTSDIA